MQKDKIDESKFDNEFFDLFFDETSEFCGDPLLQLLAIDQRKTDELRKKVLKVAKEKAEKEAVNNDETNLSL